MKDPALEKTIEFCQTFDKFFDCLNVSSLDLGKHSRNAFKSPYHHAADFRIKVHAVNYNNRNLLFALLQWLREGFLGFLDKWEKSVEEREGYTKKQKNNMLLSQETRLGLRLTGIYYTGQSCIFIRIIILHV